LYSATRRQSMSRNEMAGEPEKTKRLFVRLPTVVGRGAPCT
jgi:hypothetical protein